MNKIYDCIVIGGGISGIAFAHRLKQMGRQTLIIEKAETFGGQVRTFHPAGNDGFWTELGAHTCYNSYTRLLALANETGATGTLVPMRPFGYMAWSGDKPRSLAAEVAYLPLLMHGFRAFRSDKSGKTAREYFRPIVGAANYDRLFRYAFRAVISQDADDYPAEIFLKKRQSKDKSQPRRFTFKAGMTSFLQAVIWHGGLAVRCRTDIRHIAKTDGVFVLTDAGGECFRTRNVALAVDPQTAASLLQATEPGVSELLSTIGVVRSESVGVVVAKDRLRLKMMAGLIPLSDGLLSVVARDPVADDALRGFTFHFSTGQNTEEGKFNLICKALNIRRSDVESWSEMTHALPAMRLNHLDMAGRTDAVRRDSHVYLTGNYYYGLSLEDCVIRAEREAERFARVNSPG
jgi:protoporphyrinogen oxidase